MSSSELEDWGRYANAEPWGAWRHNLHAAQIAAILFNAYRDPKKSPAKSVQDFMLEPPGVKESRRRREVMDMFKALAKIKGKKAPEGSK